MGNGRKSGLPSGVRQVDVKKLKGFKITSKNAKQYGLTLRPSRKSKYKYLIDHKLDTALDNIGRTMKLLGMDPRNMPKVEIKYGRYNTSKRGDAVITSDDSDALVNLYQNAFTNYADTSAHEYVHAVEAWIVKSTFPNTYDQLNAWHYNLAAEAICRDALIKIGKQSDSVFRLDKDAWKTAAKTLSRGRGEIFNRKGEPYGAKNPSETLATAMQIVLRRGDSAPEFAKAVVEATREAVQDVYKHLRGK